MNPDFEIKAVRTIREVVDLLVDRKFSELAERTKGVRLTAKEIEGIIDSYGRNLTNAPTSAFEKLNAVFVKNSDPARYSVWFPLWTQEEGKSDLTLELTLIDSDKSQIGVELDNIRVP